MFIPWAYDESYHQIIKGMMLNIGYDTILSYLLQREGYID